MQIQKRNGALVNFNKDKIVKAIEKSMSETVLGIDHQIAFKIATTIEKEATNGITVEQIQDKVENLLMDSERKDVAKAYISYRSEQKKKKKVKTNGILSEEFISKYKHLPNPMNQLGSFVYYRTYSRWLDEEKRREYWWETVKRAVEYNCSLAPCTVEEAEALYDNIYHLRQFLSGRTFWVGQTQTSKDFVMSNFNCAFQIIDSFDAFKELFNLLLVGAGVGVRILKDDVEKLPKVRTDFEIIHKAYNPMPKNEREDNTSIEFIYNNTVKITVGDSKGGWYQSLDTFFKILYSCEYKNVKTIIMDYDHVRPKGEKLKSFGGTASGHIALKDIFAKIDNIIKSQTSKDNKIKLRTIDCLDISNIIGEGVVVGGVRRTAEIVLLDADDEECIQAKNNLYKQIDGQWVVDKTLVHRQMSNNSIYYTEKPTRERLHWQIEQMRYSGEPAWVNAEAGAKRRPNMNGVNPCGEILLDSKGLCNLTTLNVFAFVRPDKTLDIVGLLKAQRLSTRAGYRMTCVELELPNWNIIQKRDRLIGCSLTGWQDMINATNMTKEQEMALLQLLRDAVHNEAESYSKRLGTPMPLLSTTIKPEGTLSQLPVVSSGVHYSHSPYYIRRVRVTSNDAIAKVCEELNYPIFPENGQAWESCTTKVIEFPVKAPEGRTKYDVSAIEQLENYKMFMEYYVDHNCSITVHVRNHEWEEVEQWVWDNWDDVVAVSFLSLDDNFYKLLPYESITKEEYEKRVSEMKPFIPSLISKYEVEETEAELINDGCATGVCPVR